MKKKKSVSLERVKQAVKIRKYIPEMTPKEIKCGFKITDDEHRLESEIENGNWKPVSQKEANRLRSEMVGSAKVDDKKCSITKNQKEL